MIGEYVVNVIFVDSQVMNYYEAKMSLEVRSERLPADTAIDAYQLFDEIVLLGTAVAEIPDDAETPLYMKVGKKYAELVGRSRSFMGHEFVYSGKGYKAVEDPDGDPLTVYGPVKYGRGVLNALRIQHSDELAYVPPDGLHIQGEDDEDGMHLSVIAESVQAFKTFRETLEFAPEGHRLFVEFIVRSDYEKDDPIYGSCFRGSVDAYQLIDASTLELIDIATPREVDPVEVQMVTSILDISADLHRRQIQGKRFRNMAAEKQQMQIDGSLERMNTVIAIERFNVLSTAQNIFLPLEEDGRPVFEHCILSEGIEARCLRIDCIESQLLAEGVPIRKRRGNINSYVSLCLVAEIDDATKEALPSDTNIVWIPLFEQAHDLTFLKRPLES